MARLRRQPTGMTGQPTGMTAALRSPAAERNREPIAAVLRELLPAGGTVLEVASGSGEHAAWFAAAFPHVSWQPSDPDPASRASIAAHREAAGLPNLRAPVALDAAAPDGWPVPRADAVVCINMVHISPWEASVGLMGGAARLLSEGGLLFLYGPYREADAPLAPSNAAFDADLRARDPRWGLREKDEVVRLAARHGLSLERRVAMPANNLALAFRREPDREGPAEP